MKIYLTFILLFSFIFPTMLWAVDNIKNIELEVNYRDLDKKVEEIKLKAINPLNNIDENLNSYTTLLDLFYRFSDSNLKLGQMLLNKVNQGEPLSGDDLYSLKITVDLYYKINSKMLLFSKTYNFALNEMPRDFVDIAKNRPKVLSHLLYLSGHLTVLDHLVKMHKIYYLSNDIFRRIVKNSFKGRNDDMKSLKDLIEISRYAVSIANTKQFAEQVILVRRIKDDLIKNLSDNPNVITTINSIISNDSSLEIAQGKNDFDFIFHTYMDTLVEGFDHFTGWLSQGFGNAIGAVRWRKGHMNQVDSIIYDMKSSLKPMDVLLEKTPFSLTDKFIPGHFGHAALYLGTKEQLKAINMWNHPSIIAYQEDIAAGRVILEAIRTGVHLTTIEEFSNIDEYLIARKTDALNNPDTLFEEISRGIDQIGKPYDFNFDVETLDKIVCSELIYIVFGQVHWPTKYRLGRATITPDDIAEILYQKNTKFSLEEFIISPDYNKFEKSNLINLSSELNFEMRAFDGSEITNPNDPSNTFWKKSEKCYKVMSQTFHYSVECKTTYTLEQYEEAVAGN